MRLQHKSSEITIYKKNKKTNNYKTFNKTSMKDTVRRKKNMKETNEL